jgi:hypothetical protein
MSVEGCSATTVTPVPSSSRGEVEGEEDLRELALGVAAGSGIAALEHDVVEVDGALRGGGDVDDARGRALSSRGSSMRVSR